MRTQRRTGIMTKHGILRKSSEAFAVLAGPRLRVEVIASELGTPRGLRNLIRDSSEKERVLLPNSSPRRLAAKGSQPNQLFLHFRISLLPILAPETP